MDNVYKHGFPTGCFNCVCNYCVHTHCPNGRRAFHYDIDFCFRSRERGSCPRLDCDYFVNRRIYGHKYIIYKHENRQSQSLKALQHLTEKVEELQKNVNYLTWQVKLGKKFDDKK